MRSPLVSKPSPVRRLVKPLQEFIELEASSGILLLTVTVIALVWANSPWAAGYFALWKQPFTLKIGGQGIEKSLLAIINDGLMAIFFLLVGLEIKREILVGQLSDLRRAAFPLFAALGGMVVPATVFVAVTQGTPSMRGWGIPMATDIAFALGILALLGSRVPYSLKVFLAALAIADDMGAVLVIALFYTSQIATNYLLTGLGLLVLLAVANKLGLRKLPFYFTIGVVIWYCFLKSGVHATVAGVLLAFTIPAHVSISRVDFLQRARAMMNEFTQANDQTEEGRESQTAALNGLTRAANDAQMPIERAENSLHPFVTFFVVPIFALANAGVALSEGLGVVRTEPAALGIFLGLVIGKPVGISLFCFLAVKLRLAVLPVGVVWRHVLGIGCLGGVGFTMSLFISELAFGASPQLTAAKVAVLGASGVSATLGALLLLGRKRERLARAV
jgi:Na+:H+ antiporter, NhaA family